ncbi:hypothetical protein HDV06_001327 [Boothiomyces sp. JEL0866]|nr:hypothetical protein HDV06_001327 [Boothiomyces sp. JEL0866]
MKLSLLPKDILECSIFYYLNEQDVINLSLLNKEFHSRLFPIQLLEKMHIEENFWPEFKFMPKEYPVQFNPYFEELSKSRWKFTGFTTDSVTISNIHPPKTFELNLIIRRILDLNKFLNVLDSNVVTLLRIDFDSSIKPKNIMHLIRHFNRMSRLKSVQINSKKLDINHAFAFQKSLALTNIKVLDLKTCGIDDEFLLILCFVLPHTRIETLDLYSNKIGNQGLEKLSQILASTNIQQLVLSFNLFNGAGLKQSCSGLINSNVTALNIPGKNISSEPIPEFFDNIHNMKLQVFESFNNMGIENTRLFIKNLEKSNIKKLTIGIIPDVFADFLKALYYSKVSELYLTNDDCDKLCAIIAENKQYIKLEKLRLGKGITGKGLHDLYPSINNLKELDLQENFKLGDSEMEIVAHHLPRSNLKKLVLSGCGFKDDGLASLSREIQYSKLEHLEMRHLKASTRAMIDFINLTNRVEQGKNKLKLLDVSFGYLFDFQQIKSVGKQYPALMLKTQ